MSKRSTAVLVAVAMAAAFLATGANPASASNPRSTLPGSTPGWATPARRRASAVTGQHLRFRVYLAMRDRAGAEAMARAVSDPASSSYHQYLSVDAVRARFAPTQASVDSIRTWLQSTGVKVGYVPDNHQFVEATGTVDQVQKAFGTTLGVYDYQSRHLRAPDSALSVPNSIASTISGVVGVDQSLSLMRPNHIGPDPAPAPVTPNRTAQVTPSTVPPPDGFRNAQPCGAYFGQKVDTTDPAFGTYGSAVPYSPCGYTPPQLRRAYGLDGAVQHGIDGRNTTVAVVDAFGSPTIFKDAATYAQKNDPTHPLRRSQFNQHVFPPDPTLEPPDQCDAAGWYGEETLDVEAVHAMAPGAHIVYVGGSDCLDLSLDKALNEVVSRHLAQIVTNSYGDLGEAVDPSLVTAFQQISVQAVMEGIGVYFSSGDSGDEVANLGTPSADFSASSPWVTAVGGTTLGIGADGHRVVETGWETTKTKLVDGTWTPSPADYIYGSGGGTSVLFAEPWYQRGVVPPALTHNNQTGNQRGRVVPDISMVADPTTGMLVGETQTFPDGVYYDQYRIGGTSLSSPLFAGVMADSDSLRGFPHGFINPDLYDLAGTSAIRDVVHVDGAAIRSDYVNGVDSADGLITSLRGFDFQGLAIATRPGYDDTTGLGTPNGLSFLFRL